MANEYLRSGAPGRTSVVIEDPSTFRIVPGLSIVIIPLEHEIPADLPITFKSAKFKGRANGDEHGFELFSFPFCPNPIRYPTFLKLLVVPNADTIASYRRRKQGATAAAGSGAGPVTGDFTVTLSIGPQFTPDECKMQGTLFEE